MDEKSSEPLENAVVRTDAGQTALTDPQGHFQLHVAPGADSVTVSFIGYVSQKVAATGKLLEVHLVHGNVDLRAVTIQGLPNNATFSTISNIDVNMHALNSAQDLMRLVPGLSLMQHQGGGIADHIFFRGFDADHGTDVSVSVDDMPLNLVSHAHGQGFSDLHFLIPELVSGLEYGKGPYYADHGDFTTAGYLAFKTADVLDRSEVKVEAGAFNTGRLVAAVNLLGHQPNQGAYIAAEGFYTDGPYDYAERMNRGNLFGKYILQVSPRTQLKVTLSTFNSLWRSSGEIPSRAVSEGLISRWGYIDSAQGGNTARTTAIARLTTQLTPALTLENQVYYAHYFFDLNYDQTFFAEDSVNGDQLRQRESRDLYGYNGKLARHAYFRNNTELTSSAGLGFQMNRVHESELSHTKDYNDVLDYLQHGGIHEWTTNAYLDEQYRMGKWLFDAGVRVDFLHFSYQDLLAPVQPAVGKTVASPKLNVQYTANDRTQLYLRLGKGFHSNDARVVAENRGLEDLPSAYGADLGINWKPLPRLYLNAALWFLYLQQEFTYNGDDGTFSPGDKTRREGVDLSARYEFTRWLYADLDMIYCRARDIQAPKGQNYLPLSIPFYGSGGVYIKLPCGWNGGWSARYTPQRPANGDNSLVARGYFLNDLTANYTRRKYEVGLEIQNLFNATWRDAQYEVVSRLKNEPAPVDDVSFTPGMPFFAKLKFAVFLP
ncbi:outer membrane receptor protein involved in Fe transport [Dinghuibacter silviterrae]|uniref:Outer membrane receptor protein involved in Fe transport n=2 Tax=Dinghuibacter silviterrae TaxID=1539049 RepID=A0A4R8DPY6_9BACT|nr:outer membrane receptor protein involved in Fe transport [Dinghuibacter silviterrae]